MSHISNVILLQAGYFGDWEKERLPLVNQHLEEQGVGSLVSAEDNKFNRRNVFGGNLMWYGGSKGLTCRVAIAAFNRLDVSALLSFLKKDIPWGVDDGQCLLIILDEFESKFQIHEIFEGEL